MASHSEPRTILFLSSNGIGLGHLSRQMAIARRLPATLQPVFHSQSTGIRLAREAGFLCFAHQHHRYNGLSPDRWNNFLARELLALARHLRPAAIVVDCTVVFSGFMRLLEAYAGRVPRIWIRRGFLAAEHAPYMAAKAWFDYVIEPGDLAEELDRGPSAALRDQVIRVPPVLNIAPEERLSRAEARQKLGLHDDRPVLALLPGNTLGSETEALRRQIRRSFLGRNLTLLDIRSPLEAPSARPLAGDGPEPLRLYPAFALSRGFDAMITLAGYNSFHEAMLGKVPGLFLTWPKPGMDRQDLRVEWAVSRRLALGRAAEPLARGQDPGFSAAVDQLLSGEIAAALHGPDAPQARNGAAEIVRLISGWTGV